jgi:hypothetical protein
MLSPQGAHELVSEQKVTCKGGSKEHMLMRIIDVRSCSLARQQW